MILLRYQLARESVHHLRLRFSLTMLLSSQGWTQTVLRGLALIWTGELLMAPWAFAAPETLAETGAKNVIVALTVVIALLIGILLYQYAQRTAKTQFKREGATGATRRTPLVNDPKILMPAILEQLQQLPGSAQQRSRVARTVSDIVTQTLEEHVSVVKRELSEQYEQTIEEKRRTEALLQRKYQETLTEQKQTVAILESVAEGLVVVNNKGEVVMMNPAAERLLAVKQEDRIGKPLLETLGDEQLVSLVQDAKDGNREIIIRAKQEQIKRVLRASNAMITDEDGSTIGMVAVLSDVTRQRELEELKSEFVSKVSHDLRTPIVAMRHALSILIDQVTGPLSDEQQKFLEIVQRNLEQLTTLIDDLLDLSKLEAKKITLNLKPSSLTEVVNMVCQSLEAWAQSKSITLSKRLPERLPNVMCDPDQIRRVLTNLIGNAIKFTPKQGRVTIDVKHDVAQHTITLSVADTGVGILAEDIPKLFQKFQQVGERTHTDIAGTGLGLAIAKEIVELHHGRIWAESDGKQGASFTFSLPVAAPAERG